MDSPEVSVHVASLMQPFVLRGVSIGLSGKQQDYHSWLEQMDTSAPYTEEDFEWKIAELLPCPRSFFTLVYEYGGILGIIFGARKESLDASNSGNEGYCECCYARIDPHNRQILHAGEYGIGDSTNPAKWMREFCRVCYDSKAYVNFFRAHKPQHLSTYEHEYLSKLGELYEQLDDSRSRV